MSSRLLEVLPRGDNETLSETSGSELYDEEARILAEDSSFSEKLGDSVRRWGALATWCLTLGPILLGLLGFPLPEILGIGLGTWAWYGLLGVLSQAGIRVILYGIIAWLRKSEAARMAQGYPGSSVDVASQVESVVNPVTTFATTIVFACCWYAFHPISCPVDDNIPSIENVSSSNRLMLFLASAVRGVCAYDLVTDAIASVLLASLVLTVEIILARNSLWSFLRNNFLERILEIRYRTYIVETVRHRTMPPREPPRRRSEPISFPFALPFHVPLMDKFRAWLNSAILGDSDNRSFDSQLVGRPITYSEYRRKLSVWIVRHGLDEAVQQIALAIPQTDGEAKNVSKEIFALLTSSAQDRDYVLADDMSNVFHGRAATRDAFSIFDRDQDGAVSKSEFRYTCLAVYREMRNLAASVQDAGRAFRQLMESFHLFVVLMLFFATLAIFGVQIQAIFALVFSLLLGLNVIIGDVAKRSFQGIIFLFIDHPYDVGDKVLVSGLSEGDPLNVNRISMLTTIFTRWNGQQIYVPNSSLASATVYNISRSSEQWERIDLVLANPYDTTSSESHQKGDKIGALRDAIEGFLKKLPADFLPAYELKPVIAGEIGKAEASLAVVNMTLRVQCRPTLDSQKRWTRHAILLSFVRQAVQSCDLLAHNVEAVK